MSRLAILILAAGTLSACTHLDGPLADTAGKTHASNAAAQIVNAEPAKGAPEPDAVLTAAAIERYRTDNVKTGEKEKSPMIELNLAPVP